MPANSRSSSTRPWGACVASNEAARSPRKRTAPTDEVPAGRVQSQHGGGRGPEVSHCSFCQDQLFQCQVGDGATLACTLLLQLLQTLNFIGLQAGVLLPLTGIRQRVTPITRIAAYCVLPCANSISTRRLLVTIFSGSCRMLGILCPLRDFSPQVAPLHWGRTTVGPETGSVPSTSHEKPYRPSPSTCLDQSEKALVSSRGAGTVLPVSAS